MRRARLLASTVLILSTILSACKTTPTIQEPPSEPMDESPETEGMYGEGLKICQVTDTGGIDDTSFNETAWKGVEDAIQDLGIEGKYLESQQQTDYEKNINAFYEDGCDLIITVGFLLADATSQAAEAYPD
jgi:basic membrane protein A